MTPRDWTDWLILSVAVLIIGAALGWLIRHFSAMP